VQRPETMEEDGVEVKASVYRHLLLLVKKQNKKKKKKKKKKIQGTHGLSLESGGKKGGDGKLSREILKRSSWLQLQCLACPLRGVALGKKRVNMVIVKEIGSLYAAVPLMIGDPQGWGPQANTERVILQSLGQERSPESRKADGSLVPGSKREGGGLLYRKRFHNVKGLKTTRSHFFGGRGLG